MGAWLAASGRRGERVPATKRSGANGGSVRDGRGIEPKDLPGAVHGPPRRPGTDRIERPAPCRAAGGAGALPPRPPQVVRARYRGRMPDAAT